MPQSNRILKLVRKTDIASMRQPGGTPGQIVTRERNWCYYILAGMDGLCKCLELYCRKPLHPLREAIKSARYSVDNAWYEKTDEIAAGKYRSKKTW